ncbi:hypothetical protein ACTFIV_001789 [Dictyostelium citrinum]
MKEFKLLTIGIEGVGKTKLEEEEKDFELSFRFMNKIDNEDCLIDILDFKYNNVKSIGYTVPILLSGKGYLLVYSITSIESFKEIKSLRDTILRCYEINNKTKPMIPFILVGNKCDLEYQRQVSKQQGLDLVKSFNCPFFETSAKFKYKYSFKNFFIY